MTEKIEPTCTITVYLAGDYRSGVESLRRQCLEDGLCVTVTRTTFVYTAGAESGIAVGIQNYPRFPKSPGDLWDRAKQLATRLMTDLCQHSSMIVGPDQTLWLSRRPQE